jgi:hypothetical protein
MKTLQAVDDTVTGPKPNTWEDDDDDDDDRTKTMT